MEMRASQVIKGALGGGAKRKKKKKKDWGRNRESEEEKRRERHLQIHTGGEVWKLECHSYLAAAVKQVSNIADLTSLDTKVVLTFSTFCRFHHKFSSRNESFWVKEKNPCCRLAQEQKLILSR